MKKVLAILLTLICAFSLSGCTVGDREVKLRTQMPDSELFEMGELTCTPEELKIFLANYKNIYGSIYDTDFWANTKDVSVMSDKVKDAAFAHLTKIYALALYGTENKVYLTEEETLKCQSIAEEYFKSLNSAEKAYTDASIEEVTHLVTTYVLAKKAYAKLMEDVNPEVSDDEARVMDAIIVYNTDINQVKEAYDKSKETRDFASLAANYSQLSYIETTIGRGEYDSEVEDEIFSLDNDECSKMIETNGGYMLFYCKNKYNEELSEQKKTEIFNQRKTDALSKMYLNYQKEVTSILNRDLYEAMTVDASSEIVTDNFFELVDDNISFR
ncbi:MAG: peptidyl-prolyl cis-trans isomerase [Lachnospiraceae bacterium]|nr:peptidyl-prolyl cis-trans isomerase [Lachnospiraceae bacterium]